ncbi:MAG: hypothetical protein AVDCRST_MAG93-5336 [uncultured Chloroflexia bacterium]|uniref:Uncharacterized protein n=1 Tax=uncultured Chloroflexia bacterium TaxID=1672391 RepID=A0A6J4KSJ9_9CHLR|nr:MAG: hypothetical protein AVDCRST_MAG93-5336 [uncultured Chloroflexia bacterium]
MIGAAMNFVRVAAWLVERPRARTRRSHLLCLGLFQRSSGSRLAFASDIFYIDKNSPRCIGPQSLLVLIHHASFYPAARASWSTSSTGGGSGCDGTTT